MKFEHAEDLLFFEGLLVKEKGQSIDDFQSMFDFREPQIKRKEFNKIRDLILSQLKELHGEKCMLSLAMCDIESKLVADHLIPLSSNKLNKEIRKLVPEPGKKVKTQSFGSNHLDNLILACNKCNNHKKHKFLDRDQMSLILKEKAAANED